MADDQVEVTLNTLRSERELVAAEAMNLHQRLKETDTRLNRLNAAINSLEQLLLGPSEESSCQSGAGAEAWTGSPDAYTEAKRVVSGPLAGVIATQQHKDLPERLGPYVPVGGQRLRSKLMVFDLLSRLGTPVTREELHRQFFEYFGRENIEQFWKRPDNALNTAIDRAREEGLILEIPATDGAPAKYGAGFRETATGRPAMYSEEDD